MKVTFNVEPHAAKTSLVAISLQADSMRNHAVGGAIGVLPPLLSTAIPDRWHDAHLRMRQRIRWTLAEGMPFGWMTTKCNRILFSREDGQWICHIDSRRHALLPSGIGTVLYALARADGFRHLSVHEWMESVAPIAFDSRSDAPWYQAGVEAREDEPVAPPEPIPADTPKVMPRGTSHNRRAVLSREAPHIYPAHVLAG